MQAPWFVCLVMSLAGCDTSDATASKAASAERESELATNSLSAKSSAPGKLAPAEGRSIPPSPAPVASPTAGPSSEATPTAPVAAADVDAPELLAGLKVGMKRAEVEKLFPTGKTKGSARKSAETGGYSQLWTDPSAGLTVRFSSPEKGVDEKIDRITIEAPSTLKTARSIGIGDSDELVKKAYGEPDGNWNHFGDDDAVVYSTSQEDEYATVVLSFSLARGAVEEIHLGSVYPDEGE